MIVYQVSSKKLVHEYYRSGNEGIPRNFQWYTEGEFLKIYMNVGNSVYYYEVLGAEVSQAVHALLMSDDRIIGLFKEPIKKEVVPFAKLNKG